MKLDLYSLLSICRLKANLSIEQKLAVSRRMRIQVQSTSINPAPVHPEYEPPHNIAAPLKPNSPRSHSFPAHQKPRIRTRAYAVPKRPNQGCGLEARSFWDQEMSLFEPQASFDIFPKSEYCRCSPAGAAVRGAWVLRTLWCEAARSMRETAEQYKS